MKLLQKVLAAALVLSLAFASIPASAATRTITFENGKIPSGIFMKTDDGGDLSKLSVKKFNGSRQLYINVKDGVNKVPKLQINVGELVGAKNVDKVRTVKFDLIIVNPDKKELGWNGGGWGANIGKDASTWYQDPVGWVLEEYEKSKASLKYQVSFVKGMGYTKGVKDSSCLFMKWAGNDNDMYIDNIQFLDKKGKAISVKLTSKKSK